MPTLAWIIAATLTSGVLSVIAAASLALRAKPAQLPMLISYAIGALLGAAFLEILPHALEMAANVTIVTGTVLIGILLFFVLEKMVLWRHAHEGQAESHVPEHDHGRIATMVIVGDTFHNCVDGVIIAGAFLVSLEVGIVTALAIVAHEVPQEVSDFLILLHSGYSKRLAFGFNILASSAMVVGGVFAYYALQLMHNAIPPLLGIAAASMIYVSVADLIPGLHRRRDFRATLQQVTLIAAGIGTVWIVGYLAGAVANV
jgi:zinc and cadmium transporter